MPKRRAKSARSSAPYPHAGHENMGAEARAETERVDAALVTALRLHSVGRDLAVSMRLVRMVTSALRAGRRNPPEIANALLLVEQAAQVVAMLSLLDAMGNKREGDLEPHLHGLVAAARRLLAGFVTKGCRDLELPEGDIVYLCHRTIERNHQAYVSAGAADQAEIEKETFFAITGIAGKRPDELLIKEALAIPFGKGAPRGGRRGRLPVLVDLLKSVGIAVSVNSARGMITRATERVTKSQSAR